MSCPREAITPSLIYSLRSAKKSIIGNLSPEDAFWGAGSVLYLDPSGGYMDVHIDKNSLALKTCAPFLYLCNKVYMINSD